MRIILVGFDGVQGLDVFENPARMARAFQRTLGMSPRAYRELFAQAARLSRAAPESAPAREKRRKRALQA